MDLRRVGANGGYSGRAGKRPGMHVYAAARWRVHVVASHLPLDPLSVEAVPVCCCLMQGGAGRGARSREPSPAAGPGMAGAASGVPALDDYVPLDGDGNTRTMDSFAVRAGGGGGQAGVFSGLWFTLAAVAGTEEEAPATKLIR